MIVVVAALAAVVCSAAVGYLIGRAQGYQEATGPLQRAGASGLTTTVHLFRDGTSAPGFPPPYAVQVSVQPSDGDVELLPKVYAVGEALRVLDRRVEAEEILRWGRRP